MGSGFPTEVKLALYPLRASHTLSAPRLVACPSSPCVPGSTRPTALPSGQIAARRALSQRRLLSELT